jgi:4-hydroxy-tetrahydrodipicolinate synthase
MTDTLVRSAAAKAPRLAPRDHHKDWAREHYRGMENLLMPSFTPDLKGLDEEGIRHDVRQSIAHGFFSIACVAPLTPLPEYKRLLEIVCEEGAGRILVGAYVGEATEQQNLELLAHAEAVGCSHAVVVPRFLEPNSHDEVYRWYLRHFERTNLALVLYAQNNPRQRHLHPSGFSLDTFARLAELPNVVGVKLTQAINPIRSMEVFDRVGRTLQVGPVHLDTVPLLAKSYHVQWSGQWNVEAVQSPEKPYAVMFMDAVIRGDWDEATKIYWTVAPAYKAFFELQSPLLLKGGHPWMHMKYHQWCVGGNGGVIRDINKPRDQVPVLTAEGRQRIRANFERIGITPVARSDEECALGLSNLKKGFAPNDAIRPPLYE